MRKGLIHIYTGEGKGKTTASIGLAIRAAGQGLKVLLVQFFKADKDSSGELKIIRERIPEIEIVRQNERHPIFKEEERPGKIKESVEAVFHKAVEKVMSGDYDMLILDEVNSAVAGNWLPIDELIGFLQHKPEKLEVILTGRKAHERLLDIADYITEMKMQKHPFEKGVKARKGIEY
jgi:cob(I)alamin adenosyltransferase